MKKIPLLGFLLLLGLTPYPAQAQSSNSIRPEQVLSVVTADWNSDGGFDRALLVETEPSDTDLLIYLSNSQGKMPLAIRKQAIAWRGGLWGTQPSLELDRNGSLVVVSANDGIGRARWNRRLTVSYLKNVFTVSRYTYEARDTLSPTASRLSCDVNFLTGQGVKNGKPFKVAARPIPLATWSETSIPKECNPS